MSFKQGDKVTVKNENPNIIWEVEGETKVQVRPLEFEIKEGYYTIFNAEATPRRQEVHQDDLLLTE